MEDLIRKVRIFSQSIVTLAASAALFITIVLAYIQTNDILPDTWVSPVVTYGGAIVAFLSAIVTVIKRVMPIPKDGVQVLVENPEGVAVEDYAVAQDVFRGWGLDSDDTLP